MGSRQYFDNIAANWNAMRSEYFKDEVRDRILRKVNVEGRIVGDLGCGTGFISLGLAAKQPNIVFSLDQSSNMLRELKRESLSLGFNNIYPIRSNLVEVPLFDESLDVITINMALHHVADADKSIEEMYRILKFGGRLVISDVLEHNGQWAREEMFDEWLGFSKAQIILWLEQAGFNTITIEDTGLKAKGFSSKGEYTETGIFIATADKL
jgi:ubiquinone/menaquinone biosynthesis C-methylase UbiE